MTFLDFMVAYASIFVPVVVLLIGPHDAVVYRLLERQPLRTWHWETMVVMLLVGGMVVFVAAGDPVEWVGWAALVFSHGRNSVNSRLAEAQTREAILDGVVDCHRWSRRYLLLAEVCWAVYFTFHQSWAALCGVAVFAGYAQWRAWRSNCEVS